MTRRATLKKSKFSLDNGVHLNSCAAEYLIEEADKIMSSVYSTSFLGTIDAIKAKKDTYIAKALERIAKTNTSLLIHHPLLFCLNCYRRQSQKYIKRRAYFRFLLSDARMKFSYIICPKCASSLNFVTGIKTVVGEIGGKNKRIRRYGNKIIVPLWKEREKKARYADIDSLIIRKEGIHDYHYAINSVIIELTSDFYKPVGWLKEIPIIMKNKSSIPKPVMRMLKDNFAFDISGSISAPNIE